MGLGAFISLNGIPVPELTDSNALESIEVYERLGETVYYKIRYSADIENSDIPQLREPLIDPGSILSIMIPQDTDMTCLVKGPVFSQDIHLKHGGDGSWVDVRGGDSSLLMDRNFNSQVWANVTDGEAVMSILGTYGLVPNVKITSARHLELKHSLVQRSTDLNFVRKLARRNGCHFWITTNPFGIETAHFQQPNLMEMPAVDLVINRDHYNIDQLSIHWDVERPTVASGLQVDLSNKGPIAGLVPISPQNNLGMLNLLAINQGPFTTQLSAPTDDMGDLQARTEAAIMEAEWFIRANCQTSLHRLGKVVRTHTLANVVGAGSRHSGKYLVAGVKHTIDATAHLMEIELIRNGWNL